MRRQTSLGSEDTGNVRPQLPRQRSVTTPERDEAAKNLLSPPLSEYRSILALLVVSLVD